MFHEEIYWHGFVTNSDVWIFDFVNNFLFQFLKLKKQKISSSYLLKISELENLNFWLYFKVFKKGYSNNDKKLEFSLVRISLSSIRGLHFLDDIFRRWF
jgi:hypothetical protein